MREVFSMLSFETWLAILFVIWWTSIVVGVAIYECVIKPKPLS